MSNRITKLFGIKYPVIQAGMIWCSGWELASAVSNAGGLGVIGSGSMYPEVLRDQIRKCRNNTDKPFAVNLPLLYSQIEDHVKVLIDEDVNIVFTSAGNPNTWTKILQDHNILVAHVVSNLKFALKSVDAGVDAIVAEGFEAGGHNGREETTTMCLIPLIRKAIDLPLIAAGGIATGRGMLAAMALGAEGVQIGSRFVASKESSAHEKFKDYVVNALEGQTELTLKELTPVRLLKNKFYDDIQDAYKLGANKKELESLLGKGRAKKGMFLGDLEDGELEIGQISNLINEIKSADSIIEEILESFLDAQKELGKINF